jgi:hypothetical protein
MTAKLNLSTSHVTAVKVTEITVTDPDTNLPVEVSIFKEVESGGMFGVDSSFLANTEEPVYSVFGNGYVYSNDF